MEEKIKNPYLGLSEKERWDIYKKDYFLLDGLGFFLRRDFQLPNNPNILLVDPSIGMPKFYPKLFSFFLGNKTKTDIVRSLPKVIQKIEEEAKYDLIITATSPIGGNIYTLVKELTNLSYKGIVLLHSGSRGREAAQIVKETGIDGFMLKPHGLLNFFKVTKGIPKPSEST